MAQTSINNTISDGLGNNLFSFFDTLNTKFALNILQGNLGVTDVNLFKTELNNSMSQTSDQSQVLVSLEQFLVFDQNLFELIHITLLYTVDDLVVRGQWSSKVFLREYLSSRDFTHHKLNNNKKFLNLESKSKSTDLRTFSLCLNKSCLCLWVFKLNCLDTTQIVQVSWVLVVGDAFREHSLSDEITCLLIKILVQVRSNDNINKSSLTDEIMVQTAELVSIKHKRSELGKNTSLFVCYWNKVHCFGTQVIKSSHVDILESKNDKITKLLGILQISIINEFHDQHVVQEELAFRLAHNLSCSNFSAVKHFLFSGTLLDFSWVSRQLQSLVKIWQVEFEHKNDIGKIEQLAKFLQLFG